MDDKQKTIQNTIQEGNLRGWDGNHTPFKIRLDLLQLAHDILTNNLNKEWAARIQNKEIVEYHKYSVEDVLDIAQKLRKFVDNR